jgi:5-methylcytosine-specific restriction endonuclease McrA
MPDPKPRRRQRARTAAQRSEAYYLPPGQRCVLCSAPRPQRAHVVPRSQGGDDVRENIAPLCGTCHHDVDQGAGKLGSEARWMLRVWIDSEPAVLAYVLERKGAAWLDRRYPSAGLAAAPTRR